MKISELKDLIKEFKESSLDIELHSEELVNGFNNTIRHTLFF